MQLAVCQRHRSAIGVSEEELQQVIEILEKCCWLRHGTHLRQKQKLAYRQHTQVIRCCILFQQLDDAQDKFVVREHVELDFSITCRLYKVCRNGTLLLCCCSLRYKLTLSGPN